MVMQASGKADEDSKAGGAVRDDAAERGILNILCLVFICICNGYLKLPLLLNKH